MKTLTRNRIRHMFAEVFAIAALASLSQMARAIPPLPPTPEEEKQLVAFHLAGLHGDRAQVPAMIQALLHPSHPDFISITLVALSQMGDTGALPAIDTLIADPATQPYYLSEAKVARARLVAEDTARAADPKARAAATVRRFYQELGLTPDAINAALADPQRRDQFAVPAHALGALADMVYHDGAPQAFLALPDVSRVNFAAYGSMALKIRLAVLPRRQRIDTMVQDLVSWPNQSGVPDLTEMQLLADEEADGAAAAAAKIAALDAHPDPSIVSPWRLRLQRVLLAVGTPPNATEKNAFVRAAMERGQPEMITTY